MIDGAKLREVRRKSAIPTKVVLERLGQQNLNYLFRIERDEVNSSYEMLIRVSSAFEVTPKEIIKDEILRKLCSS